MQAIIVGPREVFTHMILKKGRSAYWSLQRVESKLPPRFLVDRYARASGSTVISKFNLEISLKKMQSTAVIMVQDTKLASAPLL